MAQVTQIPSFLREYLYVDVDRVRSIVGQLDFGVPESATDTTSSGSTGTLGLDAKAVRYERARTTAGQTATTRALGDLLVPWFEELAEAGGFLTDVTDSASTESNWRTGVFHADLSAGRLIRVTATTRILDPAFLSSTISGAGALANVFGVGGDQGQAIRPQSGRATPRGGGQTRQRGTGQGGLGEAVNGFRAIAEHLLGGDITVRIFPAGEGAADCHFSGVLLDRSNYIESERGALFAKFGVSASPWTVVGAVARIPSKPRPVSMPTLPQGMVTATGLDRAQLEALLVDMLAYFEAVGLISSPSWPSIAITPLAIYRTVEASRSPS